jgi:hypothetical protein
MQFRARPLRIVSLLVLVAVTNVYVFANGTIAGSGKNVNALLGKLITNSNRPVLVNGGDAITGTIILSGAQLITPAASGATVQLEKLGTVIVDQNSNVTLTFDLKNVTVNVASGNAMVTTVEGVKGTVIGPDGTPAGAGSKAPAPAGGSGGFNKGDIAGVAVGGIGLIIGFIALNRANNARDSAAAAAAAAAANAAALAALRACLAGQTASPVKVCTSF